MAQQRGRQRLHTRLYPVEISRALKSSESMLPVCFCSRTQGQQEARPTVGKRGRPMCTAGKQDSGRSRGDQGGPKRPGKGKGSRKTQVGRRRENR